LTKRISGTLRVRLIQAVTASPMLAVVAAEYCG
jgi:hypothetical protein